MLKIRKYINSSLITLIKIYNSMNYCDMYYRIHPFIALRVNIVSHAITIPSSKEYSNIYF